MKRSEMIEILRKAASEGPGIEVDYIEAEYIIFNLEDAGMHPPQSSDEKKFYLTSGERWHTSEFLHANCQWEPEEGGE